MIRLRAECFLFLKSYREKIKLRALFNPVMVFDKHFSKTL
jgi:hypothetical protein